MWHRIIPKRSALRSIMVWLSCATSWRKFWTKQSTQFHLLCELLRKWNSDCDCIVGQRKNRIVCLFKPPSTWTIINSIGSLATPSCPHIAIASLIPSATRHWHLDFHWILGCLKIPIRMHFFRKESWLIGITSLAFDDCKTSINELFLAFITEKSSRYAIPLR